MIHQKEGVYIGLINTQIIQHHQNIWDTVQKRQKKRKEKLTKPLSRTQQFSLSLPSQRLSMLATSAPSNSPPTGYQSWLPTLPPTPLPSAINAAYQCSLSLPSHWLSMLSTNAPSHYPPIGYQCCLPVLPPTPLPSASNTY